MLYVAELHLDAVAGTDAHTVRKLGNQMLDPLSYEGRAGLVRCHFAGPIARAGASSCSNLSEFDSVVLVTV